MFVPIVEDYRRDNTDNAENTTDAGTSYKNSNNGQSVGDSTFYNTNISESGREREAGETFPILATPKAPCKISIQVSKSYRIFVVLRYVTLQAF